jgi:heme a synthase
MTAIAKSIIRFSTAVFLTVFLVIIAGGVVRTTQSGMGCPDWPKCFGRWIPPTSADQLPPDFEKYLRKQDIDHTFNAFHTWIEYINRLLGVLLGLLAVIQVALLYRFRKTHRQPFRLALLFLALVIATGLFGALVVKFNLAHLSISIHLAFALLLAVVQLWLLHVLRGKQWRRVSAAEKNWLWLLTGIIVVQFVLGTLVRMYVDEISKSLAYESRPAWLADAPIVFLIHRSFSWLVLGLLLFAGWKLRTNPLLKKPVLWIVAFGLANMLTGIVLFYAHMPAAAQPVHLTLAALMITLCGYLLLSSRNTRFS